jgi:hypothetical protein
MARGTYGVPSSLSDEDRAVDPIPVERSLSSDGPLSGGLLGAPATWVPQVPTSTAESSDPAASTATRRRYLARRLGRSAALDGHGELLQARPNTEPERS